MMILLSDIHLTDESTAINVDPTAFELLSREIATQASQRGATEIHVVLLGDIFDLVRTSYWMSQGIAPNDRPWGGTLDPQTGMNTNAAPPVEKQFGAVLKGILESKSGKALISMLESLPSLGQSKPRVSYVIGNHDRVLNNFVSLQDAIRTALPGVQLEFTNSLQASAYGLLGRHGHEWDENCHGWQFLTKVLQKGSAVGRFDSAAYKVMAIGEPITAELMGGLIFNVEQGLKENPTPGDDEFLKNLKDVNNLRPMEQALSWVNWFTRGKSDRYLGIVRQGLLDALNSLLDCSLAKRWDDLKPDLIISGDITDYLDRARNALKQSKNLQDLGDLIAGISNLTSIWHSVFGSKLDDLEKGAGQEFADGTPPGTQYIVYGHTHVALHDTFHAEQAGGVQIYINTGTYLPLVERALDEKSFVRSHQMTMLFCYSQAEDQTDRADNGPTVDLWSGIRRKVFV